MLLKEPTKPDTVVSQYIFEKPFKKAMSLRIFFSLMIDWEKLFDGREISILAGCPNGIDITDANMTPWSLFHLADISYGRLIQLAILVMLCLGWM